MQSSGLSSVVPFVPFGCSSRSTLHFHKNILGKQAIYYFNSIVRFPSIPQTLHSTKKNSSLKNSSYFFALFRSSSSHGLYPAFGRAYASTIPLHSVSLRKLRYTTFQQYYVCRPQYFQRLLLRTAIGVGSVITLP